MTDIVKNDPHQLRSDGVRPILSRRDFLKLTSVGLAAFYNPFKKEKRPDDAWLMPVEFRFGDHNLHQEDVDSNRYALIMGETTVSDLWYWHNVTDEPSPEGNWLVGNATRLVEAVKNHGFGSSYTDHSNNIKLFGKSRRLGINVATTDSRYIDSIEDERRNNLHSQKQEVSGSRNALLGKAIGLGSLPLFVNTLALVAKKLNILDKTNKDPTSYVGNLEKTVLKNAKAETFFLWFTLSHWQEAETFLQKITDTRPNTELGEIIIQRRNTSMAHNCRLIESVLAQNPELRTKSGLTENKKALIYAGIFHAGLEKEYKKGITGLKSEMKELAQKSVDFGFWFLNSISKDPESTMSEQEALDFFVYATQEYSLPVATFYGNEEYKNAPEMKISDSGRLILWERLTNAYGNATGEDKKVYEKLIKRLLKEDIIFFSPGQRSIHPEKQVMFDRMKQLRFNNKAEEGIDLSFFSDETYPAGSRQILYISEGVPFFVNQMSDGTIV